MRNWQHTRQLHLDSKSRLKLNMPKTELPIPVPHLPLTTYVRVALPMCSLPQCLALPLIPDVSTDTFLSLTTQNESLVKSLLFYFLKKSPKLSTFLHLHHHHTFRLLSPFWTSALGTKDYAIGDYWISPVNSLTLKLILFF